MGYGVDQAVIFTRRSAPFPYTDLRIFLVRRHAERGRPLQERLGLVARDEGDAVRLRGVL